MSLRRRIEALEHLLRLRGDLGPRCASCGSPPRYGIGATIIDAGEALRECSECRWTLDSAGRPVNLILELHDAIVEMHDHPPATEPST